MKLLSGGDLAGFIKERQARQVHALLQEHRLVPQLIIIQTKDDPVINTYVRLKKSYGEDISVAVESLTVKQENVMGMLETYNHDPSVHGIIVQLPLSDPSQTDILVQAITPAKDVDKLGVNSPFTGATAGAINWLLAGYNIRLDDKKITIIGNGRLVGQPLYQLWRTAGYDVTVLDNTTQDLTAALKTSQLIVTATGVPGLLTSAMIPIGAVVVDAGVASEAGKTVGDVAPDVYERHDVTITTKVGGVGPLTVAVLFDNVIRASSL